jgi:cyclic-di-AMP phosphodiesterase PgpH
MAGQEPTRQPSPPTPEHHRRLTARGFLSRQPSGHLRPEDIPWPNRARVLIAWALGVLLTAVILVVRLPLRGQVTLQIGDVATADVVAPRQATYVSEILTQQRRDLAANAVPDVYDPPQTRVMRAQLGLANRILDSLAAARSDTGASLPDRVTRVGETSPVSIAPKAIERILTMPQGEWDGVASEIQNVLERAMREEIRENNLADERRKVAARVRLDLSDEDALIVTSIVQGLLVPNSFFNAERTEQRRQQAREGAEPVTAAVERNEIILRTGDIATALDIEALESLGLRQNRWSWKDVSLATVFVLLLGILLLYYLWRQEPHLWLDQTKLLVLLLLLLAFLLAARIVLPGGTVMSYLFPYAALAMILGVLLNLRVALVTAALFALMAGWLTGGGLEPVVYAFSGSLVGALKLRRGERLASFGWAAGYIMGVNLLVLGTFRLGASGLNLGALAELVLAAVANGLLAMTLTLVGVYLLGSLPGMTTALHLLEISRPTHPLLRQLLLKAPGTYHHTLIVSNMAERAAEAIGADSLLTRVGAYYHDVGKTIRPFFFIENRNEGIDPHAQLDPYTSAQIIIGHVKDGIELARKYRLPRRVTDFIPEHHGTTIAPFFYREAVKQSGGPEKVDRSQFEYPGPKPRSRETAITMLADGAEATVRSRHPSSVEELQQIVSEAIQARLLAGQLDESSLTMEDLHAVQRAFIDVLRGLQHPRIDYPAEALPERVIPGDEDVQASRFAAERAEGVEPGKNQQQEGTPPEARGSANAPQPGPANAAPDASPSGTEIGD